ncbi:DUF58 domain-containing protein [Natronolimnobius baerhuensis]|uniref:DUF58 domain-containing protein n=1 Tax=Natronolimnobius baerhuensis TaxID=253108 RepID=A0A202EA88_9EURY|nr:DUF58 domain-containing protein [Natronolimnobius baerhuensis]OVE85162.1 DUF58 domain-containing protein [Natronolimnobius baerhuensis]
MHLETRLRTCGALALALVGLAILFDSVVVLLGASALCGWLLARSLAFAAELERTLESLHVEQELERTTVRAGATVQHSVTATLATPSRLRLTLEATVPPTATLEGDVPTLALTPGMSAARVSQPLSWPVAGHYDFDGVTITATDGFFRKTISLEQDCSITVETSPAAPTQAKTAGTQFAAASDTSRSRLGTRGHPAYAREYVPGDSLEQIDWKATARLGTTYIREFETATSQPEHLIVDHRGADANTRTALQTAALSVVSRASRNRDPIGVLILGDDGLTASLDPTATDNGYRTVQNRLYELEAAPETQTTANTANCRLTADRARAHLANLGPPPTTDTTTREDDPFVSMLRPFYDEQVRGTDGNYRSVESLTEALRLRRSGPVTAQRTTLLSAGTHPADLHRAVSLARTHGDVTVGLATPSSSPQPRPSQIPADDRHAPAETGSPAGLETDIAHTDALEDAQFRRQLARQNGITVRSITTAHTEATTEAEHETITRGEHR